MLFWSDSMFELIKRLSDAHGISGYEEEVREIVREELEGYVDEVKVDKLGNIVCVRKGDDFKIMLAAHIDEIGFMVKHIDDRGFLRITPIGGWFSQTVLNQRVIVHGSKGKVYGVVGCKPPHLMKEDERKKVIEIKDMFVDVGAENREEVKEMGIDIGSPVTMDREVVKLGKRVTGKAFDNRVGLAVMIEAMKKIDTNATVYAVGTVQEEVGLKGARVSAFSLNPDVALVLDSAPATDFPGAESAYMDIKLGKGPVITVADASGRGLIASKRVLEWLKDSAKKAEVEIQLEVGEGGTTDATAIHLTREGIPSGVVSVPARYIHTPVEVIDLRDAEQAAKLVAKAVEIAKDFF